MKRRYVVWTYDDVFGWDPTGDPQTERAATKLAGEYRDQHGIKTQVLREGKEPEQ